MFKNWSGWLGAEKESGKVTEEPADANEEKRCSEINKPSDQQGRDAGTDAQLLQKTKGFSGYIYNFASSASKKLSESVVETAQTLKKSVEEGKICEIIDKTILGDFQKEQERFVQEKRAKEYVVGAAVPPWVGYNEEDAIQEQILALSADKRHFLRDPPAGVQFYFDFDQMYSVAMVMLEEDELLRKMRFHLVPKQVKEEVFWRNYFYRVSLIKQSAQLTALAAQQAAEWRDVKKTSARCKDPHQKDAVKTKTNSLKPKLSENEEELSASLHMSEFVSDAFDSCEINKEDLCKEMRELILDKRENLNAEQEEMPDWERELQEELQEYDVLADSETHDDNWDREIEEMLKEES